MPIKDETELRELKLFAAIFLDGEIGGGPLEGLDSAIVADNIHSFLTQSARDPHPYDLSAESLAAMQYYLKQISETHNFIHTHDLEASAQHIFEHFEKEGNFFFPGGWTAFPAGHAMIYRLFKDKNGDIIFLSFNTGSGVSYHKQVSPSDDELLKTDFTNYREQFNPVFAIRFSDKKQVKEYGGLKAWIKKLIEPMVLPESKLTYVDANAEGIYKKIFTASAYLGGEVIDPTPYFQSITSGQHDGTCAQQSIQKMLQNFFKTKTDYDRFFLDYRIHVLNDFLTKGKIPQSYRKEFYAALANTTRMISSGKSLEQKLTPENKQLLLSQLKTIKKKADEFFIKDYPDDFQEKIEIKDIQIKLSPPARMPSIPNLASLKNKPDNTPLLLFDKTGSLIDALKSLKKESQKTDKRIFVHNIEQLCFTFLNKLQNFRERPFEKQTIDDWQKTIELLNTYATKYFDYKKSYVCAKQADASYSSPRNQLIALGLMGLVHYATIMCHAEALGHSQWNADFDNIDHYLGFIPGWFLFDKMLYDPLLSSTDPDISRLFSCLKKYFITEKDQFHSKPVDELGMNLTHHYKKLIESPCYKDEKMVLEHFFKQKLELLCASDEYLKRTEYRGNIVRNQMQAFYIATHSDLKSTSLLNVPPHPHIKKMLNTQLQADSCIYFCTKSILKKGTASLPVLNKFDMNYFKSPPLLGTSLTLSYLDESLYLIPQRDDWEQEMRKAFEAQQLSGPVFYPLMIDVSASHLNSNQIRLLPERATMDKELIDLRTSLPLQAVQVIDYFTRHMDLLEDKNYQHYMLYSLFQPEVLDLGIKHQSDILRALQCLYQKGNALGDLAEETATLSHRGLFLLKIISWVHGYILSCPDASETLKKQSRKDYEKFIQILDYWLSHEKHEPMQTELQRLSFYSLVKLYFSSNVSLEKRLYLKQILSAQFHMQQHIDDRIPEMMSQTEDESFEPLILKLQTIDSKAVLNVLPEILNELFPDQAPFSPQTREEALNSPLYYCLNKDNQLTCVNLITGSISQANQKFVKIPSLVTKNHAAYKRIIGSDASFLSRKINDHEYQFHWQGEEYHLSYQSLFKKINDEWHEYHNDHFLPEGLRSKHHYAWVNSHADAFVMNQDEKLLYQWQGGNLKSYEPEGVVCLNGEIRERILKQLACFEGSKFIDIILLNPPEAKKYYFRLPRYQLSGGFDESKNIATLNYDNALYYIHPHPSPLKTGFMISQSPISKPSECLLIVPRQPFYTKKTINGSHYELIHDLDCSTTKEQTSTPQSYVTFHFDDMHQLITEASSPADSLYLIYLYCARYEFDKAYELLKKYSFQGNRVELTYLYWICKKLPAAIDKKSPISNTKLLAIKLTALALFSQVQEPEIPKEPYNDLNQFFKELPDHIIEIYTKYHNLSNNISDEERVPQFEIEHLADYVWLRLEKTKRDVQKEILKIQGNKLEIEKKKEIIKKCEEKQTEGYLAYAYAKTPHFSLKKDKVVTFSTVEMTVYNTPNSIIPHWPTTYTPLAREFICLNEREGSKMEFGQFYLFCSTDSMLHYRFIDALGERHHGCFKSRVAFIKDEHLSLKKLNLLKSEVLKNVAKQGHVLSPLGTLTDLQKLLQNPALAEKACQQSIDSLSLDISDDALFTQLKYYFYLIISNNNEQLQNKLKDFCQRTILACADLNTLLKDPKKKATVDADTRCHRLQIAIVLLHGLENPNHFRKAYNETTHPENLKLSGLANHSIWKMISDKKGFYSMPSLRVKSIPSKEYYHQEKTLIFKKKSLQKPRPSTTFLKKVKTFFQKGNKKKIISFNDPTSQRSLKTIKLPSKLVKITQELRALSDQQKKDKSEKIKHYKALPLKEQQAQYDETDRALDKIEAAYCDDLGSKIAGAIQKEDIKELKRTLMRMTESLLDDYMAVKHYASALPYDMQALLRLEIKQLGAKQLPLSVDTLLKKYALGLDESFLEMRQLPKSHRPRVRQAAKQFLHHVFLYRQYERILETLQQLNLKNTAHQQGELQLQLAKQLLEVEPLKGNAALELFQYQTGKTVRADQWALIQDLATQWDKTNRNKVGQLIMGGGKSKVILPILAFLKADGHHLATIEVPDSLLQTAYQDLRPTAKAIFNQDLELFSFHRNSPDDTVSLMSYLRKFHDIIQQKKCLIMAPTSLQSLHLKWRELLYQAQSKPKDPEVQEQIDLLSEILDLFKERGDGIIDEVHKVLDINLELNYSIGQKTALDPILIQATLDLYDFLKITQIQAEKGPLAKLNGKRLADILKEPELLNHPPELISELMTFYSTRYSVPQNADQDKIKAFLKAQWSVFLPLTLKQKLREQYGPSPNENIRIAIPYAANNIPTKNLFANFIESLNYTTQMSLIEGICFDAFKTTLHSWKKSDQEHFLFNKKGESEAEKRFKACRFDREDCPTNLKAIDLTNNDQLQTLYTYFQKNELFIRYALEESILPSIQLYRQKLTSNAINHANQVKRIQGLSGTPENYPTFDHRIDFDVTTSFGTKNYLKTLLKDKNTPLIPQNQEKDKLAGLSAIIDIGAHCRGKSNQEVAEELAAQLVNTNFRYILFFQDNQLCAWPIGGTSENIIKLSSTEADKIEEYLKVKPEQCFSYYDQSHATGIDLRQHSKACAAVSVDVTTTLSSFLQAVSRMRELSAGQTVNIFLSPILQDKLGENPTLDHLYEHLEKTERDKLAHDVFKSACKKLYNVVQMDLDERLRKLPASKSISLFKKFQHLLVDKNSDDIIELYGKEIKEGRTDIILKQIRDATLKQWKKATSSRRISSELQTQCDKIIEDALNYCQEKQQTTVEIGTEINIEQQQEVQTELKTELKMELIDEKLKPNKIDTRWAQHCSLKKNASLTGTRKDQSLLSKVWRGGSNIEWSKNLSVSCQFYMTHNQQSLDVLPKDHSLKPILSTLFWKQGESVHALITSQEEATVLAKRLSSDDNFNNPSCQVWLESMNGLTLAGIRPDNIEQNFAYSELKEQIYTFDGEAPLLAAKKELLWFGPKYLAVLQKQMMQQGKTSDSTTFKELEKKLPPVDAMATYLRWRQTFESAIKQAETSLSTFSPTQKKALQNGIIEAKRIIETADKYGPSDDSLLLNLAEIYSRTALALKFSMMRKKPTDILQGEIFCYNPKSGLTKTIPIHYSDKEHKQNTAYIIAKGESLKGSGIPWLKKLGLGLGILAACLLVVIGILAAIPSGGTSLLSVAIGLVGIKAMAGITSSIGLTGLAGGITFFATKEPPLVRAVRSIKMDPPKSPEPTEP